MFWTNEDYVLITDTPGLLALAQDAHDRGSNRQAWLGPLREHIDPAGIHVLTFQLLHNDCEWRTSWFIKIRDYEEPVSLWLDVSLSALADHARKHLTGVGALKLMAGERVPGWET